MQEDTIASLEAEQTRLLSDQEALNLALAQARNEIDAGAEAARGALTVVCVRRNEAGEMKAASIPPEIADLIEVAPADKLAD